MIMDASRLPSPSTRWAIPNLIGSSFAQAPAVTTLTAVTAALAGAAPVGSTMAIGELVDGPTSAIGHGVAIHQTSRGSRVHQPVRAGPRRRHHGHAPR
ncbi:hypothetical protein [Actinospica robiniae]|uniref:hypothetical protein n=1 Tax=Actinospica robiniae TaxID=304901 RepID=UPI0005507272|nr:hypothetical protein [Actinospica robiniae]